jgi:uncharacterized membrane protein SpoIIM required for sporulation
MIRLLMSRFFLRYFFAIFLIFLSGMGLAFFQDAMNQPDLEPFNATELQGRYTFTVLVVIPHMQDVFPLLFFLNGGIALFILLVPLYWIWIWWFKPDFLPETIYLMRATVFLLLFALGHNTFVSLYELYKTLPFSIFSTYLYPHGILEVLAYVLSGSFALIIIDEIKDFLQQVKDPSSLNPGDICIFILRNMWISLILVILILAVAAVIECWITPFMVASSLQTALTAV